MDAMRVRLVGPKVRQGKVSVDDLILVAEALQRSIERFVERKELGTPSLRKGPRTLSQKSKVNLYLTDIKSGSTSLEFEPGPGQLDLAGQRVGSGLFLEWVQGAHSLQDPNQSAPESFDRGVLSGIHELHPLFKRGVDRIEIEWQSGRKSARAVLDAGTATRTESLLMRPTPNRRTITGVMLEADFHSPEVVFTVYTTEGQSVRCTAGEDEFGAILSGLLHMVRVTGDAEVDSNTGAVVSFRADSLELEGESDLPDFPFWSVNEFWSSPDLTSLESRQGIPIYDPLETPEWQPPSDDEWERYQRVLSERRRPSAGRP